MRSSFSFWASGRAFNAYNDLNQMAADGARLAAVGNFPSDLVAKNADTPATQSATITGPTYSSGTCVVGATVTVTARGPIGKFAWLMSASSSLTFGSVAFFAA